MPRRQIDLLFSALIVVLLVWVVWEARDWPFRTRLFPWAIGIPVLALALVQLGLALRSALVPQLELAGARHEDRAPAEQTGSLRPGDDAATHDGAFHHPEDVRDRKVARRRAVEMSAWTLAFFVGIWFFGFRLGAPLLSFAFLRVGARENWKTSAVFAIATYLFFLFPLEIALAIPLPRGLVLQALGLDSFDVDWVNSALKTLLER